MKDNSFIYRINIKKKLVSKEKVKSAYHLLGGRSLTSRVLLDELDPSCEPLGPKNKLVLAPGLLSGTSAPCSGRLSIGGKSPLTGGIKESNSGGTAAIKLAKLGIKAIIIEDIPENNEWYSIKIVTMKLQNIIKTSMVIKLLLYPLALQGKVNIELPQYLLQIWKVFLPDIVHAEAWEHLWDLKK